MNLAVLRGLLKKTEMQVDLVQSGLEAIAAVQKERYDLNGSHDAQNGWY